jgi:hypothetical protein
LGDDVELWKCDGCGDEPCIINEKACKEMVCNFGALRKMKEIEKNHDQISLDDLEFGQEIEIKSDGDKNWQTVKYAGKMLASSVPLVNDGEHDTFAIGGLQWRLPIKDRIRRGQPIIAGGYIRFFEEFDDGHAKCHSAEIDGVFVISCDSKWRLPTEIELKKLGQDGLGWLSEG